MRQRSVHTWKVKRESDPGYPALFVTGHDYEGNTLIEFVFDEHLKKPAGQDPWAKIQVSVPKETKMKPLTIYINGDEEIQVPINGR